MTGMVERGHNLKPAYLEGRPPSTALPQEPCASSWWAEERSGAGQLTALWSRGAGRPGRGMGWQGGRAPLSIYPCPYPTWSQEGNCQGALGCHAAPTVAKNPSNKELCWPLGDSGQLSSIPFSSGRSHPRRSNHITTSALEFPPRGKQCTPD